MAVNFMSRVCLTHVGEWRSRFIRHALLSRSVASEAASNDALEVINEEEEALKAEREAVIERKRNKSRLRKADYDIYHGRNPYITPETEYHDSLRYKRRAFGKFGFNSGVDPSALWPTKEELENRKEFESVAYPFTIQEMVKQAQEKKDQELKLKRDREQEILTKVVKLEQLKKDFHDRVQKRAEEAAKAKEKKDRMVAEIRRHFGFNIDPKDDRFKEMLEKKEKEAKKLSKAARMKQRDMKLLEEAKLTADSEIAEQKQAEALEKEEDEKENQSKSKKK